MHVVMKYLCTLCFKGKFRIIVRVRKIFISTSFNRDIDIMLFRCSPPCSRAPKSHENRGKSATQFQKWKCPGNLRGTWNTELCRFLTKSKSIYKNPSRTPYKPLVEIMNIKWNKKIWCSRGVHGNQKSTHENFVSAWFSSSGTQDWTADLMIMNHAL